MKNRKVAAYLGIALFALTAGCGSNGKEPSVPAAEAADTEFSSEQKESNKESSEDRTSQIGNDEILDGTDSPENQSGDEMPEGTDSAADDSQDEKKSETLPGSISSIGEDTLVVSRAFEEGEDTLVAYADGSLDQVLVSVLVSEDTEYEVRTVKNGGVNGDADVEVRDGTFSDLERDANVKIEGYFKGEEFVAQKITVYRFV